MSLLNLLHWESSSVLAQSTISEEPLNPVCAGFTVVFFALQHQNSLSCKQNKCLFIMNLRHQTENLIYRLNKKKKSKVNIKWSFTLYLQITYLLAFLCLCQNIFLLSFFFDLLFLLFFSSFGTRFPLSPLPVMCLNLHIPQLMQWVVITSGLDLKSLTPTSTVSCYKRGIFL